MSEQGELINQLGELYHQVDMQSEALENKLGNILNCKQGCHECCIDELSVFEIEAVNIKNHYQDFLINESPADKGGCAFLDVAGACRIYDHRPYVCRTQGLPLRWMDYDQNDELVEMRDICPLNDKEETILDLPEDYFWTIGSYEEQLAKLQLQLDGGTFNRVALRSLFVED
ncbi:MAG: YkgJ family cysteine cluster protein [Bacteroidales bacterium]|nr:YkgJ family cysteine cluster protein [Bacteroidales bacterium]